MTEDNIRINFELTGGIGNQLFQYSAAKYFEIKKGVKVVFINQVNNDFKNINYNPINKLFKEIQFKENIFSKSHITIFLWKIDRKLSNNISIYSKIRKIYSPKEIGFLQPEPDFTNVIKIRGYFQSYKYAEGSRVQIIRALNQLPISPWTFNKMSEALNVKPISMHIRRGDYIQQSSRYGLLDESYYLRALSKLTKNSKEREIWIFSDDLDNALVEKISNIYKTVFINKPEGVSDLEVLLVMSKCSSHVIANSTFSWWAAYLSESSNNVVAPKPWTISGLNPNELLPPNWITVDSGW